VERDSWAESPAGLMTNIANILRPMTKAEIDVLFMPPILTLLTVA
jgi:hypothetical protein